MPTTRIACLTGALPALGAPQRPQAQSRPQTSSSGPTLSQRPRARRYRP